jgi:hypothetical protein
MKGKQQASGQQQERAHLKPPICVFGSALSSCCHSVRRQHCGGGAGTKSIDEALEARQGVDGLLALILHRALTRCWKAFFDKEQMGRLSQLCDHSALK